MHGVSTAFTTSKINEADLAVNSPVMLENHLHDGVGAGAFRISSSGPTRPEMHSNIKSRHDRLHCVHLNFCQVDYVYLLFAIFSAMYSSSVIEQVKEFAAVYFIEGQVELQV